MFGRPRQVVVFCLFLLVGSSIFIYWLRAGTNRKIYSSTKPAADWAISSKLWLQGENDERLKRTKPTVISRSLGNAGNPELLHDPKVRVAGQGEKQKSSDVGTRVLGGYVSVLDNKPLKMNCKTCALVSSSGRILKQNKGSEIDAADCVFRMNSAPVKGFETDVGHKTTVRIVSQFSVLHCIKYLQSNLNDPLKFFIAWGSGGHLSPKSDKYKAMLAAAEKNPQIGFYCSSDEHYWSQDVVFKNETGQERLRSGSWLTTGWFTFDVLKSACQRTKIYGMIPEDYCRNGSASRAPYHYWEAKSDECVYYKSMENRVQAAHRFMSEKSIFARWALKFNMTFHTPDWDPRDYTRTNIKFPTIN